MVTRARKFSLSATYLKETARRDAALCRQMVFHGEQMFSSVLREMCQVAQPPSCVFFFFPPPLHVSNGGNRCSSPVITVKCSWLYINGLVNDFPASKKDGFVMERRSEISGFQCAPELVARMLIRQSTLVSPLRVLGGCVRACIMYLCVFAIHISLFLTPGPSDAFPKP